MKKIMFNDRYGLTKAVLEGRKTMTRRIVSDNIYKKGISYCNEYYADTLEALDEEEFLLEVAPFKRGEVVAVAQSYKDIRDIIGDIQDGKSIKSMAGWNNKMFVSADLMPHQIRITDVRVERLQDISEDDVYKEGFSKESVNNGWGNAAWHWEAMLICYDGLGRTREIRSHEPKEAFSFLIDHICGNGTWERNPWVFVYEFKLVK